MGRPADIIRNSHGERIAYSWTPGEVDVVVIGHGVTSDKERPWSQALSSALEAVGIATMRIAFSGNGASEGRFVDSHITKEVADLGSVIDALHGWRISYVGHSMGGAVGAVRASEDSRIRALVSLAAIAHTREFAQRLFGHLVPGRDFMLDKPHCLLGQAFMDDLLGIESLVPSASSVPCPWLLVHGTADEIVPVQDSIDMARAARSSRAGSERVQLVELAGVDHSFQGDGIAAMTAAVVPWLSQTLGR